MIKPFTIGIITLAILYRVPQLKTYIGSVTTFVHEMGHAVVALLTRGRVKYIELHHSSEGLAQTSHRSYTGEILTALAGYVSASAFAYLSLYLFSIDRNKITFYILIGLTLITLLFWIKNLYGTLWCVLFGGGLIGLLFADPTVQNVAAFALTVILTHGACHSAFDILMISIKKPRDAGDATVLAKRTRLIPTQVWGVFFFLQAIGFLYLSYVYILM